mmetsp:Transcript_7976/g.9120  ORF Transcript_7976/g.9120 Transcript_7976/m.9120 type:complete len:558 (-) Transcript_7976:1248-2921(-)
MSSDEDCYFYSDDEYQNYDDDNEAKEVKEGTVIASKWLSSNSTQRGESCIRRNQSSSSLKFGKASEQIEYQILTPDDLFESQNKLIEEIQTVLNISSAQANVLLLYFRWNKETLYDKYYENPEKICAEAGALGKEYHETISSRTNESGDFLCPILYEKVPYHQTYSMGCTCKQHPYEHRFSAFAWREYLAAKVEDGPECIFTKCPMDGCPCVVTPAVWKHVSTLQSAVDGEKNAESESVLEFKQILKRYQKFLLNSYVDISRHVKWCPGPGCDRAIMASGAVTSVTCTGCDFQSCFRCGTESHAPASCTTLATWLEKCNNESETANWIIANTKKCPKCNARIEKNQGCNHMTCRICKHDFCWICMGPWSDHGSSTGGFYNCNKFTPGVGTSSDEAVKAKQELERYLHYYQRYAQHQQAAQIAAKQRKEAENRMTKLQGQMGSGWIDVQFLDQAVQQVIESRKVLKYTYAFAYYLPDGPKKVLFEHNQADLESYTEKLSELSEKPVEQLKRTEVINYTRVTAKFIKSLLQSVEQEGMVELATEEAIKLRDAPTRARGS